MNIKLIIQILMILSTLKITDLARIWIKEKKRRRWVPNPKYIKDYFFFLKNKKKQSTATYAPMPLQYFFLIIMNIQWTISKRTKSRTHRWPLGLVISIRGCVRPLVRRSHSSWNLEKTPFFSKIKISENIKAN